MSLPNVHPTTFMFEGKILYYVSYEKTKHEVTKAAVIANGARDLCWASGNSLRDIRIQRLSETPPERVIWIPKGDILCLDIEPPYNGCVTMYLDIASDENVARMVTAMLKRCRVDSVGKDYAMYGGNDYRQVEKPREAESK